MPDPVRCPTDPGVPIDVPLEHRPRRELLLLPVSIAWPVGHPESPLLSLTERYAALQLKSRPLRAGPARQHCHAASILGAFVHAVDQPVATHPSSGIRLWTAATGGGLTCDLPCRGPWQWLSVTHRPLPQGAARQGETPHSLSLQLVRNPRL